MADSGYYIGACPDCMSWLVDAHAQNNALGYSGTNSGGRLVVALSEWDHNKTGISTNSQNNDDAPSPQDGSCPQGGAGPHGTGSCTFFLEQLDPRQQQPERARLGDGRPRARRDGHGARRRPPRHDRGRTGWSTTAPGDCSSCRSRTPAPRRPSRTAPAASTNPGGLLGALGVTCYFDDFGNDVRGQLPARQRQASATRPTATSATSAGSTRRATAGTATSIRPESPAHPTDLQTTHGQCGDPEPGRRAHRPALAAGDLRHRGVRTVPADPGSVLSASNRGRRSCRFPANRRCPNPCAGVPRNSWCEREDHGGH